VILNVSVPALEKYLAMTLIASFKIHDVPVLIGDFLLTDDVPGAGHIFIPTKPDLAGVIPELGRRRICGLRKKVHIIGDRLALGYTGSLRPGRYLISKLHEKFSTETPSVYNLEEFLKDLQFVEKNKTELAGWIWEKRPLCFHWKGTNPEKLNIINAVFTGSGGQHFENSLTNIDYAGLSPNLRTALDKAVYIGACKAGNVLLEELSSAENLKHHYGYSAEIVLWDGKRFFYNDKLVYAFWNIMIDRENDLHIKPSNVCAAYKNLGEFSAIQITHMGPRKDNSSGLEATDTFVQVITPIYDDMVEYDLKSVGRISLESGLWFSGILLQNPLKSISARFSMVSECSEKIDSFTWFKDGILYLNLKQLRAHIPPQLMN
jgi:hypothetical protein